MRINSISTQQYSNNRINNKNAKTNNSPAFKGFYEKVAGSSKFQGFVGKLAKSDRTFTYLMVAESVILSTFYALNAVKNKNIEKEQKPQMVINEAMVLGVSSTGALFLDDKVSKVVTKVADKYFAKPATQEFYKGLGKNFAEASKNELLDDVAKGAQAVVEKMGTQLKTLVGKPGELKSLEISPDRLKELQAQAQKAINSNSGNESSNMSSAKHGNLFKALNGLTFIPSGISFPTKE